MEAIPDMCHTEMNDMCIAGFTLDALEELRRSVRTSDIQITQTALQTCYELNSTDDRTLSFIKWGKTVVDQM